MNMKKYKVYKKESDKPSIVVKIGFSWGAFIFGPLWFLLNKMWFNFVIVASAMIGFNALFDNYRPATHGEAIFAFGMAVFYLVIWFGIGFLSNRILCAELEDEGYKLKAIVEAKNAAAAREAAAHVKPEPSSLSRAEPFPDDATSA